MRRLFIVIAILSLTACANTGSQSAQANVTPGPLAGNCQRGATVAPTVGNRCGLVQNDEAYTTGDAAGRADPNAPDHQQTFIWILSGGECVITDVQPSYFACAPIAKDIVATGPPGITQDDVLIQGQPIFIHRTI